MQKNKLKKQKLYYIIEENCYNTIHLKGRVSEVAEIVKRANAGTMESSDAYVEIEPGQNGIEIELESVVADQFGDAVLTAVRGVLKDFEIKNVKLRIVDRGALDCVIRARVETAVLRGKGEQ